ncbi:uncharacterized protein CG3556 [Caerostris darwini]|uniref:Uncharacterized protein CG3556 n=1 Tax=Caerostris darwini TaxID=1538125 RepID=A0AAV4P8P2_9ARAC|nr:uncharacterized protein CG3556 [Caerostris darwini]
MYLTLSNSVLLLFALFSISSSKNCTVDEFPCDDGGCVPMYYWCDTYKDCKDKSDEAYCAKVDLQSLNDDPNKCSKRFFKCDDGPCIPLKGRCDGYQSCEDKSDEMDCEKIDSNAPGVDYPETSTHEVLEAVKRGDSWRQTLSTYVPSDFSHELEMARGWLLSQRQSDFGWGEETSRALTALYLADERPLQRRDESDQLMIKQLEVQLALDMARNGSKPMKLTDLALYINALTASCKDPKNFHGNNLVLTLRNMADSGLYASKFVGPLVYMTLCMNNATTYNDSEKIEEIFTSRNVALSRIDIQSLAMLSSACMHKKKSFETDSMYENFKQQFLGRMDTNSLPGNVYEAALMKQALNEMDLERTELTSFLLKQQQKDGSFGSILATYLVMPVLAGKTMLRLQEHCNPKLATDFEPIEVLKNKKRRRIQLQYSLNYGLPVEVTQSIQMQVAEGTNFLDVMRLAQEMNPKFSFKLNKNHSDPVVYSIGGVPNDAEKGLFWTLHVASTAGLLPYNGSIKQLIAHAADEMVFWMKPL